MTRPKKSLPENAIDVIQTMTANGAREVDIAAVLGVCWQTMDRERKEKPEIAQAFAVGNAVGHEKVIGKLMEKCLGGDTIACIFLAKTKYGYRENISIEQTNNIRVTVDVPAALTAEKYGELIEHED